jgi:hypothetical protein
MQLVCHKDHSKYISRKYFKKRRNLNSLIDISKMLSWNETKG